MYNIFWIDGYCCIPQSINKIKKLIDWVSKPPKEENLDFALML
jgi:hypothetical protein